MATPLVSQGFISSISYDNLTPWYTTVEADEEIVFTDSDGTARVLNSLVLESDTTELYIQILPSNFCYYIPASGAKTFDLCRIKSIKILGASGQNIRWSGLYF